MSKLRKPSAGEQSCLRILHLSDFHFRPDRAWDQDPVLTGLAAKIGELFGDGLAPDVVAFTGDIAHSGKQKEYAQASRWIDEKLRPSLSPNFDVSRMLFVPGNHDVQREKVGRLARLLQDHLLEQQSQDPIAQALTIPEERGALLKRHSAYLEFVTRFGPEDTPIHEPWWSTILPIGNKSIQFVGLCSSWMSCGDQDYGRLLIGTWQLNQLLASAPDADMRVVLVHHPWEYLPDFDRTDIKMKVRREVHVVLRGHLHEQDSRVSVSPDDACVELTAGSVYEGSKHANSFQLIELIPNEMLVRVHYWLWHRGKWIVDRNAYENASEGIAEFSLRAPSNDNATKRRLAKTERPSVPVEYRTWLQTQCAEIELLGLSVKHGHAVRLNHIYVPLVTTPHGKDVPEESNEAEFLPQREAKPTLLLEQLNESSLYVPGAPGAGKSTFCRWVAYLVARGTMPQLDVAPPNGFEEAFPTELRDRLPLLVRLRDFWHCLPMKPGCREMAAAELEEALDNWIDIGRLPGVSGSDLRSHLANGSALLILDGVDEVPLSHGDERDPCSPREMLVSGLINALPQWQRKGNRVLLTSRPYGLGEDSRRRLDLRPSSISALPSELQKLLISRWFHTLTDNAATAQSTAEDMMQHIRGRIGMDALANNPMLLTAMCIVYGEGKRLPQDTYDLYSRIVDNVLHNRFPTDPVVIEKVRNRLAVVAHGMHTGYALSETRSTPLAVASYDEIDCILRRFQNESPETEPGVQHTVETREQLLSQTGLLLPQGEERAAFYHLSLQEFLAAQRILNFGNAADRLFDVFRERAVVAEWRKTLSFLFACLVAKFTAKHGIELLTKLVEDITPDALTDDAQKKAVVVSDCVEILIGRGIGLQDGLRDGIRRICMSAFDQVKDPDPLWVLGVCLGRVGDPGLTDDLRAASGTDAFVPFTAATQPTKYVTRYPVTNGQYEHFIIDGGYGDPQWWSAEGWMWRTTNNIERPQHWEDAFRNGRNHPVVGVSFHEAQALAAWMAADLPTSQEVRDYTSSVSSQIKHVTVDVERSWPVTYSGSTFRKNKSGAYVPNYLPLVWSSDDGIIVEEPTNSTDEFTREKLKELPKEDRSVAVTLRIIVREVG